MLSPTFCGVAAELHPQQRLVLGRLILFAILTVERSSSLFAAAHKLVCLCETNIGAGFFVRNAGVNYTGRRYVQRNQELQGPDKGATLQLVLVDI